MIHSSQTVGYPNPSLEPRAGELVRDYEETAALNPALFKTLSRTLRVQRTQ